MIYFYLRCLAPAVKTVILFGELHLRSQWLSFHMNPTETVAAFKQLKAKKLLIVHWGSFRLGDEPVHFPPQDLTKELEKEGLTNRWAALRHGKTLYYRDN